MGFVRRLVAVVGAAVTVGALGVWGAQPAVAAPSTVITVGSFSGYEYLPTCSNTAPFACGQSALVMSFRVYTSRTYSYPITIGWELFGGTATAGVDYTGPLTGTVTIAAHTVNKEVNVPLVNDGFGESTETFRVRVTSATVPANLTSVGTQSILDGSRVPGDCSLSKNAPGHEAMTCTNRPAGQTWYLYHECFYGWGDPALRGNNVTGSGTSEGNCTIGTPIVYAVTFNVL